MTEPEVTIDPALQAAWQVMIREIEWFRTLDDDTLERIVDTAPRHTPEYVYATAVLNHRAPRFSARI